eukprot:5490270-Pyramimonas_sp.AAC.1
MGPTGSKPPFYARGNAADAAPGGHETHRVHRAHWVRWGHETKAHGAYKGPGAPWSHQLLGATGHIELAMLLEAIGPIALRERVGLVGLMGPIGAKGQ